MCIFLQEKERQGGMGDRFYYPDPTIHLLADENKIITSWPKTEVFMRLINEDKKGDQPYRNIYDRIVEMEAKIDKEKAFKAAPTSGRPLISISQPNHNAQHQPQQNSEVYSSRVLLMPPALEQLPPAQHVPQPRQHTQTQTQSQFTTRAQPPQLYNVLENPLVAVGIKMTAPVQAQAQPSSPTTRQPSNLPFASVSPEGLSRDEAWRIYRSNPEYRRLWAIRETYPGKKFTSGQLPFVHWDLLSEEIDNIRERECLLNYREDLTREYQFYGAIIKLASTWLGSQIKMDDDIQRVIASKSKAIEIEFYNKQVYKKQKNEDLSSSIRKVLFYLLVIRGIESLAGYWNKRTGSQSSTQSTGLSGSGSGGMSLDGTPDQTSGSNSDIIGTVMELFNSALQFFAGKTGLQNPSAPPPLQAINPVAQDTSSPLMAAINIVTTPNNAAPASQSLQAQAPTEVKREISQPSSVTTTPPRGSELLPDKVLNEKRIEEFQRRLGAKKVVEPPESSVTKTETSAVNKVVEFDEPPLE